MRIAHLTPMFLPASGGAESVVHHLASHQSERHRPVVIVRWNRRATALAPLGYRVVPLLPTTFRRAVENDTRAGWHRLVGAQIRLLQLRYRFDVWHVHAVYPDGWGVLPVLDELGVPAVLTSHGADLRVSGEAADGTNAHLEPRLAEACPRFAGLVAISAGIDARYRQLGADPSRIRCIPNGVDAARVRPASEERRDVVRRAYRATEPVLLTVANDTPHKRLDLVPEIAAALTSARSRPFTWLVIGPFAPPGWAREAPAGVRVLPRLSPDLRGGPPALPTDGMLDLYHAADLLVVTSVAEGLPLAVLEAMAAGLPVVTSAAPGCTDLVTHGVNGLVCPVGDGPAMAANIARLLDDDRERRAMGEEGRRLALSYDWTVITAQYEQLYRDVIETWRPSSRAASPPAGPRASAPPAREPPHP